MNITESQKHAISEKLNRAIEAEHIMLTEAARNLGTSSNYLSMIRYPKQWPRCAKSGWEAVYQWANSGQKIREYSTAHGRTMMPEVKQKLVAEVKEALKETDKELTNTGNQLIKELQRNEDKNLDKMVENTEIQAIKELAAEKPAANISTTAPLAVESVLPEPGQQFTDTARLKVALDIEINLVVNGQKVQVR